jgi:hypothetical protein
VDRLARWVRLDPPAADGIRRFVLIQIDGLAAAVFDRALAGGYMPHLARSLRTGRLARTPMSVGLPSSTPAFQAALMYGVRPDIPGFHYYDRRAGIELHFPRLGAADFVERRHADGRRGILHRGACFGAIFTGGAGESVLTFTRLLKPTRAGLGVLRGMLSTALLAWVVVKCVGLTTAEIVRFVVRVAAHPRAMAGRRVHSLALKLGVSIWVRQFFTLAASADLYRGLPAVYVNYLDYDVFAHAFGPGHRNALQALRRVDRSIHQLARVVRRLPELHYDLYVCSDHGQTASRYFGQVSGGRSIDEVVHAILAESGAARAPGETGRTAQGGNGDCCPRSLGLWQRIWEHGERDDRSGSPRRAEGGIRVIAAGPNAFVYFLDSPDPLLIEEIEHRHPGAVARLSAEPGIGLVLARSATGAVCWWRGRPMSLDGDGGDGPFAARADREIVLAGLRELMAMPSAGDLVLYGTGAGGADVSFIDERGAHAGPSEAEMNTFLLHPPGAAPPAPITHPTQLYPHFAAYTATSGVEVEDAGLRVGSRD